MKNFKFYKSALALLTAATITLMGGCSKESEKDENLSKGCYHVTFYYGDDAVTFKECEGYTVTGSMYRGGSCEYTVKKNDEIIIDNEYATNFNSYYVNHDTADDLIDNDSIQKVK